MSLVNKTTPITILWLELTVSEGNAPTTYQKHCIVYDHSISQVVTPREGLFVIFTQLTRLLLEVSTRL